MDVLALRDDEHAEDRRVRAMRLARSAPRPGGRRRVPGAACAVDDGEGRAGMSDRVVAIPVPEPERYVTRGELARIMGISVATIDRMVADGMPSETWGRRSRRFRPSVAIAWARKRGRSAA
jgi:hypothetical protein